MKDNKNRHFSAISISQNRNTANFDCCYFCGRQIQHMEYIYNGIQNMWYMLFPHHFTTFDRSLDSALVYVIRTPLVIIWVEFSIAPHNDSIFNQHPLGE